MTNRKTPLLAFLALPAVLAACGGPLPGTTFAGSAGIPTPLAAGTTPAPGANPPAVPPSPAPSESSPPPAASPPSASPAPAASSAQRPAAPPPIVAPLPPSPAPSTASGVPSVSPPFLDTWASSEATGYGPGRAIDGSTDTDWKSSPWDAQPSLTLDLGTVAPVAGLAIKTAPGQQVVVTTSLDDRTYLPATSFIGASWTVEAHPWAVRPGRYIRLTFPNREDGGVSAIVFEARAIGG